MVLFLILLFSIVMSACAMSNNEVLDIQSIDPIERIPALSEFEFDSQFFTEVHPDAELTTLELVKKYGYGSELHEVTTEDGYILELHRVTKETNSSNVHRPVALVMHGLLCSSACWVVSGPEKGLAYILADEGYDVWLANERGNTYSRKHTHLSVRDKQYWNFSFHEIGIYDLPAMIDYILQTTGQKQLFYLGHSQGTTTFFVMASELPEYQSKIRAMFAMAPVAYCGRLKNPIMHLLAKLSNSMHVLLDLIGKYEFNPPDKTMRKFQQLMCANDAITQPICANVLFLLGGFDPDQFNMTLLPIILGHTPAGASTKQMVHFAQLINTGFFILPGKFQKYDYFMKNIIKYGTITPPRYNLEKIKVPVSLHYGSNDGMVNVKDVDKLHDELPNPVGKFLVPKKFNHLDFMWAIEAKELIYEKILSLMTRF